MSDQNQSTDTGRDCPYCGGVIYRVENESGNVKTAFHNCKMCGARWSDSWSLTSPGNRGGVRDIGRSPRSKQAAQKSASSQWRPEWPTFNANAVPTWAWILIVLVGAYFLVRLGLLSLLNALILPLTVVILGYIVFRIGKEQRWW